MKRSAEDKRKEERVGAALPVKTARATGVARDVSASGMFFETDASYAVGSDISLALDLDTPWGKVHFDCRGEIVRVESHDGRMGVGVRFTEAPRQAGGKRAAKKVAPKHGKKKAMRE